MLTSTIKIGTQAGFITIDNTTNKVGEFPVVTFNGTFQVSQCLSENSMDTDLHSPLMYETSDSAFLKDKLVDSLNIGDLHSPRLEELDPSLELAVDIQELIQNTGISQQQDLFPDIYTNVGGAQPTYIDLQKVKPPPSVESIEECSNQSVQMPHLLGYSEVLNPGVEVKVENQDQTSTLDLSSFLSGSQHFQFDFSTPVEGVTVAEATSTERSPIPTPSPRSPPSRNTLKAIPASKSRRRSLPKDSDEYRDRRERNNIAVRKSRDKAKKRQVETEGRVKILSDENQKLQKKVDLLTKELTVLKGLFTNVGAAMPEEFKLQFEMLSRK